MDRRGWFKPSELPAYASSLRVRGSNGYAALYSSFGTASEFYAFALAVEESCRCMDDVEIVGYMRGVRSCAVHNRVLDEPDFWRTKGLMAAGLQTKGSLHLTMSGPQRQRWHARMRQSDEDSISRACRMCWRRMIGRRRSWNSAVPTLHQPSADFSERWRRRLDDFWGAAVGAISDDEDETLHVHSPSFAEMTPVKLLLAIVFATVDARFAHHNAMRGAGSTIGRQAGTRSFDRCVAHARDKTQRTVLPGVDV